MDTEQRIYNADEAQALLSGTTAGPWTARPGHTHDIGQTFVVESDPLDIDVAIVIDVETTEDRADAALIAAAPDLAASVEHHAARADAAEQECAALRAIIEGRTVPSATEIPTHEAAGGRWLVGEEGRFLVVWGGRALALADFHREYHPGARWWSLDGAGRPCAWPVAADGTTDGAT